MKKILSIMLPLVALVACVNVGGGSNNSEQTFSSFSTTNDGKVMNLFATAPVSYSPTSLVDPTVGGTNSCYTVTKSSPQAFIYYPTTSCINVARSGGTSPATTTLTTLKNPKDVVMSAGMDESGNGYFNVKGQLGGAYLLRCNNVINGFGGTCLPPESVVLPPSPSLGTPTSFVSDSYGRLYVVGFCTKEQAQQSSGNQCIFMSSDGAKTWNSITDTFSNNYSQVRFSSLLMAAPTTTNPGGELVFKMSFIDTNVSTGVQNFLMQSNIPASSSPSGYTFMFWNGNDAKTIAMAVGNNIIAVNASSNTLYQPGTVGNNYGTPGTVSYFGVNPVPGPQNPPFVWQSQLVDFPNTPNATAQVSISIDDSNNIFITLNDGSSFYGTAPR